MTNEKLIVSNCQYTTRGLQHIYSIQSKGCIRLEQFTIDDLNHKLVLININLCEIGVIPSLLNKLDGHKLTNVIFIACKAVIGMLRCFSHEALRCLDIKFGLSFFKENPIGLEYRKETLSLCEMSVISKLASGIKVVDIAYRNNKSIKTISHHKISALRKLNLDNNHLSLLAITSAFSLCV